MTSAAIGTTSPKMPSAATLANARSRRSRRPRGRAARTAARRAHGSSTRHPALAREARLQRVANDRDEPRPRSRRARPAWRRRVIGPAPGTGSRASRRAGAPRAAGPTRRARARQRRRPARGPAPSGSRARRGRRRTSRRPPTSSAISAAASRRPSSERTSTWRGRSSIASRIAWWPPAAASRPWISTITRSASRSTSLSTCELTITVRPSAPSCLNSAMRCTRCTGSAPFSGSSSTSTCGSHHERGGDLRALAHALAEAVDAAGRRRRASRPIGSAVVGRVPVGDAVEVGDVAHELAGGEPGRHRFVLGHERQRAVHTSRSRRGSRPSTRTVPWLTPIRPVIARISVVLPAPFGPSRPVTPGTERAAELRQRDLRPEPHRHARRPRPSRRRRTPGRRPASARRRSRGVISVPPSGSGAGARRRRRPARRRTTTTASSPPLVTPLSGSISVDVAEEHEVAQVQRQARAR